ncbi:MAG: DUF1569 domain-containing protein [Bacteroidota bacterium]
MRNFFDPDTAQALADRLDRLTPETRPEWGSMSVGQMLAHCSKPFESVYDPAYARQYPKPRWPMTWVMRFLVKPVVVSQTPYRKNGQTAPSFRITGEREFEVERDRLKAFIGRASGEGAEAFEGRESHSFGALTAQEWSRLFYKHTDHHLTQFGV